MMVLVRGAAAIVCVLGLGLSACADDELVDGVFTEAEWTKINSFSPLPSPPPSPTNRFADHDGAALLGQKLFFEKRYSGVITLDDPSSEGELNESGRFSCASCHDPNQWFIDTRSKPNKCSVGAGQITRRNSPSMVNIAYYEWGGWGGAQDQFWKQGANSPETRDLNGDRLSIAHMLYDDLQYRTEYKAVFGEDLDPALADLGRFPPSGKPGEPAWETMSGGDKTIVNGIMANVGKAFEAYERRLVSDDAPIDRYVAGDFTALSPSAKRGLKLFIGKAGCDACHTDQTFTDQKFHNTAVMQTVTPFDEGRYDDVVRLDNPFNGAGDFSDDRDAGRAKLDGIAQTEDMRGQFRTKSLRHVAETGPYFHDGSAATLEDVIRHYNRGGASGSYPGVKDSLIVPLNLSDSEIRDLVEFLKSLTGQPVDPALRVNPLATVAPLAR